MNILNDKSILDTCQKTEIEQVQKQKQEYYLLGEFLRTRGLKMYGFNFLKDEVFEVKIQHGNTVHLVAIDGKLTAVDYEAEKCTVDSRFDYFEALNYRTACNRVKKYKEGKIKQLSNLRKYNPNGIDFFSCS